MDVTPDIVFIVPYRDRLAHKKFFLRYMKYILEDHARETYDIIFCHQVDKRTFNRGAMKNFGLIYLKTKYPETYQRITMVFNDIDCVPYIKDIIDYKTTIGKIKHFYGFQYALGGIVSMTCLDFESINGFPNYWGWGFEDNAVQNRLKRAGKYISRNNFFNIGDNRILHLFDTFKKSSDKNIPSLFIGDDGTTGISSLHNIQTNIQISDVITPHIILNITSFETESSHDDNNIIEKDMREKNDITITSNISPKRATEHIKQPNTNTNTNTNTNIVNSNNIISSPITPIKPQRPVANNPRNRRHGGFSFGFKRG